MRLLELAERLGCELRGDGEVEITGVAGIETARAGELTFLANPRYAARLADTCAAAVVIAPGQATTLPCLVTDNPCLAFSRAVALVRPETRNSATLSDVCPFPVNVAYNTQYRAKYFFSKGALAKIEYHLLEQDVFSANGTSLAGVPFRFNVQLFFDGAGIVTRYVPQGVQQKVPLPDGGIFLTAGRINWQLYPGATYILLPDNGAVVNLEGFCAALE